MLHGSLVLEEACTRCCLSCIVETTRSSENNTNCHFGTFQQMWLTGRTLYKVIVREYVMTCTEWQQNALHWIVCIQYNVYSKPIPTPTAIGVPQEGEDDDNDKEGIESSAKVRRSE